jgi:hypothetical protein
MDIGSPFMANLQPAMAIEPGQCPIHQPSMMAQALAGVDPAPRNAGSDAPLTQGLLTPRRVVPFVGVQLVRSLTGSPTRAFDRLDDIDRGLPHFGVMDISSRLGYGERDSVSVNHNGALRARFAAIRRIRPGISTPRGRARSPNPATPTTSRLGLLTQAGRVAPGVSWATHPLSANLSGAANMSCRCRSPSPGEASPTGCRCTARTRFR